MLKDQIKIEIRKAAAVMIRVKIAMLLITCLQLDQEIDPILFANDALETAKNFIPNNIPFIQYAIRRTKQHLDTFAIMLRNSYSLKSFESVLLDLQMCLNWY